MQKSCHIGGLAVLSEILGGYHKVVGKLRSKTYKNLAKSTKKCQKTLYINISIINSHCPMKRFCFKRLPLPQIP
jgi:hypothetical protein